MIGIDILETDRVKNLKLERIFTQNEILYINKFENKNERIAGFFCAKEALVKALDKKDLNFLQVEINHTQSGKPFFVFSGELENYIKNFKSVELSISHTKTIATAICFVSK